MKSQRAKGFDGSVRWQVRYEKSLLDFDFAIIKASQGNWMDETAPSYPEQRDFLDFAHDIKDIPIKGAYHYFTSSWADWMEQVHTFLDIIDKARNEGVEFDFYALDLERHGNTINYEFSIGALKWMKEVKRLTGKKVILYSNPGTIHQIRQLGHTWPRHEDLWIAQYPFKKWSERILEAYENDPIWSPRLPAGHKEWKIWQFTADENGAISYGKTHAGVNSHAVDINVFNGTRAEMEQWVGKQSSYQKYVTMLTKAWRDILSRTSRQ